MSGATRAGWRNQRFFLWGLIVVLGLASIATQIFFQNIRSETRADVALFADQLPRAVIAFERSIGYAGLIHNFKNHVLRPDEPRYRQAAIEDFDRAMVQLDRLEEVAKAAGIDLNAAEIRATLGRYRENLAVISDAHARGLSRAEIDALVRIDDAPAALALNEFVLSVRQAFRRKVGGQIQLLNLLLWTMSALSVALPAVIAGFAYLNQRRQRDRLRKMNALNQSIAETNMQLKRSNKELEQFAYIASHDLRAPLRALSILPKWIRRDLDKTGGVTPDIDEHLGDMKTQVDRMDRLLGDLLEYSRIGRAAGSISDVVPVTIVEGVRKLLQPPAAFEIVVEGDLPTVEAIPTEVELVLRNLISNAIKHHDREAGRISVRGGYDGGDVFFEVSDDGPGIAPGYHERIFEMFSTLRSRDEVEGSGMGLALIKKIVERWGGRITVFSNPDERGTTFRFTMPSAIQSAA